jgi:hypothetical protein
MLILLYLIVWWKSQMISFEKIKRDKFLNGHITYQSHMLISMYKPSTYACLWPIEFCQIVVTLGRIFSCSHDWDHVHPHIQANFHTGSYAKRAIHPPKVYTPKFQRDFTSCILAKGERGHWKKSICSKNIDVIQSKSIGKKWWSMTPSKIKEENLNQGVHRITKKIYSTHLHISIKLHD